MNSLIRIAVACLAITMAVTKAEKKIVCYLASWAVYRPDAGKFEVENIDPHLCTHIIYTFVGLEKDDVKVLDPWQDLATDGGKDGFKRFNDLRKKNPNLKTLIAIGGWNEGSEEYSKMAASARSRANFIKRVVKFVKEHDFDGFDVDWEYPAQRGGKPEDVENFTLLLKEMREAFDKKNILLTAAVGAAASSASKSYNISEISKHLHFINMMAYDFHGSWETVTGLNAPLYPGSSDTGSLKDLTVDAAVKYWLSEGAPAEKLILGVALYGRSYTLTNPDYNKVGDYISGPGEAGPYTRANGSLGYNEICKMQNENHWTVRFDEERRVPYTYRDDQWVSYDNIKSVKEKAEYIKEMGLGGGMIWSLDTDDFNGDCREKFPLTKTLRHVLRNEI